MNKRSRGKRTGYPKEQMTRNLRALNSGPEQKGHKTIESPDVAAGMKKPGNFQESPPLGEHPALC